MRKVLYLFLSAALISVLAYPEIFITFKTSFILWYDYVEAYFMTFILTSFFYQGGIQLWDMHGQMPMAYSYLTFGLFKFQNVIAALSFVIAAPFSDHTGQTFQQVFGWGNLLAHLFLRVTGIYLLLHCLKIDRRVLWMGTVLLSVFFSQPAFLWGTYMMSFYPLAMYLMVRFVQEWRWRYVAAYAMLYVISVGNGLIYVGALHVGLHFFIISCVGWGLVMQPKAWLQLKQDWFSMSSKARLLMTIGLGSVAALIIVPYLILIPQELGQVAFGADQSRISQPFNPDFYFNKLELSLASAPHFLADTFNFVEYGMPMIFFGWMSAVLALIGLVFSRQSIKWVFAIAILFLWLLNHPRDEFSIGSIAHWMNALTNPLKTITRSYLVVTYTMLSYLWMPLAILGVDVLLKMINDGQRYVKQWAIIMGVMIVFVILNVAYLPNPVQLYMIFSLMVMCGVMISTIISPTLKWKKILVYVLGCFVIADMGLVVMQSKKHFHVDCPLKPAVFDSLKEHGLIEYEYQNPTIVPWYDYAINSFSYLDEVRLWSFRGVTSNYYHVTNHALNFLYENGHSPRHIMYKSWQNNEAMKLYINNSTKIIRRVPMVIADQGDNFQLMARERLSGSIAVIEATPKLNLPQHIPKTVIPPPEAKIKYQQIDGVVNDWVSTILYKEVNDLIIISFKLPKDFPQYLATTLFSEDKKYLQFMAQRPNGQWVNFKPVQGSLINPYTFDVQHMKEGMLSAAFPKNEYYAGEKFRFLYAVDKSEGVVNVWQQSYDNLGLTYRAQADGWILLHYPFSTKWRISVDGKPVTYYKANKSFMAFPIQAGDHRIHIQYWPHTPLRLMLLISAILTTIGLIALIWFGLRWEKNKS